MTNLLERAFQLAAKLSPAEQDVLAARLLAELAAEDDFDRTIDATSDRLTSLATEATAEYRAGRTQSLNPERL